MIYEINKEILDKAAKCPHNYRFLRDDDFEICPVVDYAAHKILFVDAKSNIVCPYKLPFADSCICHCPVKTEIYRKYETMKKNSQHK